MTGIQLPLSIPTSKPLSIRLMVLEAMAQGDWWRLESLSAYCRERYGSWVSDATISARLRELAAQGHPHETRPRGNGSSAVEYRMVA